MPTTTSGQPAAPPAEVPGPDSLTWRYAGDWRGLLTSRSTLLLQVAHPVVGAGVADHSSFVEDRWGRLRRTLESTTDFLGFRGTGRGLDEAARLRELHKDIKGVDAQGRRYHALNPEAYLWVHATLFHGMVEAQRVFARPIGEERQRRLYAEWQGVARVLGITERHIPGDLPSFRVYFDEMVRDRLEGNDTVRLLLELERRPLPPPAGWRLPAPVWTAAALPPTRVLRLAGLGTLPPVLRERFGVSWTAGYERRFRLLVRTMRAVDAGLPERLRSSPLAARAMRDARRTPRVASVHHDDRR